LTAGTEADYPIAAIRAIDTRARSAIPAGTRVSAGCGVDLGAM